MRREKRPCSFEGCSHNARKSGLCETHYSQTRRGQPLTPIGEAQKTAHFSVHAPDQLCSFHDCDRKAVIDGLCDPHYRQRRRGQELAPLRTRAPIGEPRAYMLDRFHHRDRSTGCWDDWPYGQRDRRPVVVWEGKPVRVAQVMVLLEHGEWAVHACHTCDNERCWNPAHLYAGDAATNQADARARGRKVLRFRPDGKFAPSID